MATAVAAAQRSLQSQAGAVPPEGAPSAAAALAPATAAGGEPLPADVKLLQAQLAQAQAALRQEVERRTALQNLMEDYEKTIATMIGAHAPSGVADACPRPLADR